MKRSQDRTANAPQTVEATGYRIPPVGGSQMYSGLLVGRSGSVYMSTCDLHRPAYLLRLRRLLGPLLRVLRR